MARFISLISSFRPGTNGILYLETVFFADNLSPINSIASGEGPIKIIPDLITFFAKEAFSDKNPYPG